MPKLPSKRPPHFERFLPDVSGPDRKRIEQEVMPLLRLMPEGNEQCFHRARQIIESLVVSSHTPPISAIDKLMFLLACSCSGMRIPGYATLDEKHIGAISNLVDRIRTYANDPSQKRPLVFLMLASPGAGKSHFIKCVARQLTSQKVGAITYNMAGLRAGDDMIPPLDAARNLKVEDRLPLLFLDEFDSDPGHIPMLLPLLWEGEVTIGQRDLKLGKVIIVLAGSDPTLPATMEDARSMRAEGHVPQGQSPKMIDLLSRINGGVVSIPQFFDAGHAVDRRPDKVCIAVHLLRQRFGDELHDVPLCLLRFIARAEFRYDVRSIAHLVSMIPHKRGMKSLKAAELDLPLGNATELKNSSLAYHLLHQDQAFGVEKLWKEAIQNDCQMPVNTDELEMVPRYFDETYSMVVIARALSALIEAPPRTDATPDRTESNKRVQRTARPRRR